MKINTLCKKNKMKMNTIFDVKAEIQNLTIEKRKK